MSRLAVKVGELYALLRLDKAQWDKSLKDAERGLDSLAKKAEGLTKIGQTLTGLVTVPIVGIGAATVKMASDAEQAAGKFNVAFGSMAAQARDTLTQLAEDMQRSRFEMERMAADAQAILGPMIRNREVAAQLSQALAALTVDLASYTNLADSDVHQRLISGLLGSTQATELLGISLRATTLQAEAERLGLQANIATLDDATQIRLRFIAILRQSVDAQTDAIRSGESFESQLRALRADVHELSVTLGQELMPYAMAAVRWARDLAASLKELSPQSRDALIQFGLMAAAVGPLAIGLGKVAQGITLTGRALIALTNLVRANPYVVLGAAAAALALSIEEVRNKIDELFEALGFGQPFEAIENLVGAFKELDELVAGLEFDPAGAQEEAMQRLRNLYQETLRALEEDIRSGFLGAADAATRGAADLTDALRRIRREAALVGRQRLIDLLDPGRGDIATETAARLAAENEILTRRLRGVEAERLTLETSLAITRAKVAEAERERDLIADLLEQHREDLRITEEAVQALRLQKSQLEAALEISTRRAEKEEEWLRQIAEIDAQLQDQLAALEAQVEAVQILEDAFRGARDRVKELGFELSITKTRLDRLEAPDLSVVVAPPTGLAVQPGEERIAALFDRLQLRFEAGLLPVEEAIVQVTDLRSQLMRLATQSGSLWSANERQLQLLVQLNAALEQWLESLREEPSRLDQIREAMSQALGPGAAVEREIARATGATFDPIAYEMGVLERAIREMYEATGEITPEMERLMRDLHALGREHQALALEEAVVRTALDSVGEGLGDVGRVLASSIRFEAGRGLAGFSFDPTAFLTGALSTGIGLLFQAIGGLDDSSSALQRAAETLQVASESWRRTLAEGQFHELVSATPEQQIEELRRARAAAQAEIESLERRWLQIWSAGARAARIQELQDMIRDIDQTIRDLETTAASSIEARIEELLGITQRGLQGAVAGAFSASTAEDFATNIESALEGRVRNAFVTAFLESAAMAPLFEQLGDMIREALVDIRISPDEMEGIREIMDEIKRQSEPLYELLDEMGLLAETTERVNREFGALRNVPAGFKIALTRFTVATPATVPTFHSGGVMPYDGLANLRRGEVILTPEQARSGMGSVVVHVNVQGNVYGEVDIERAAKRAIGEALRQQRMAAYGVT